MRLLIGLLAGFLTLWGMEGYNGKSFVLVFPSPSGTVMTKDRNISVLAHPSNRDQGVAILPIDYHSPLGEENITWVAPGKTVPISITIQSAAYPIETLSVEPSKVTPPPEALERIERERAEAQAIYEHFTPIRYWSKPFIQPLDTFITSEYGSARTYNGTLKSYHGGVDFRARTPIPILASNDGIVVLAEDRYYAGGTIVIDHGEGIYTCYFHLSRFEVKLGDQVKQGENIALSGATGRITGPHLHFGMMVYGIQSDPLDLIAKINALFEIPKENDETIAVN